MKTPTEDEVCEAFIEWVEDNGGNKNEAYDAFYDWLESVNGHSKQSVE